MKINLFNDALEELLFYLYVIPYLVGNILGKIFPTKSNLWIFGAGNGERFIGNSKYAFLHLANNDVEITPVWITSDNEIAKSLNDHGYNVIQKYSIKGVLYTLKSEFIFVSNSKFDVVSWCTSGSNLVQLWHGVPLKKIEFDLQRRKREFLMKRFWRRHFFGDYDFVTTTSASLSKIFSTAFKIERDKIRTVGYPRNDVLFSSIDGEEIGGPQKILEEVKKGDGSIITYLPTWRPYEVNPMEIFSRNLPKFECLLEDIGAILIIKPHPLMDETKIEESNRIRLASGNDDIYPVLRRTDLLITDYSSVYFDYLLLDKPVIFFSPDLEKYQARNGMYFGYLETTPGPIVSTFDELLTEVRDSIGNPRDYQAERTQIRNRFFDYQDCNSTERLYQEFKN